METLIFVLLFNDSIAIDLWVKMVGDEIVKCVISDRFVAMNEYNETRLRRIWVYRDIVYGYLLSVLYYNSLECFEIFLPSVL